MTSTTQLSDATMDAMYATWTGDPALAPWTNDVHLDIGLLSFNYFFAVFITTICVAGRLYVRKTYLRRLHLDDWLLLGAWLAYIVYTGFLITVAFMTQFEGMAKTFWKVILLILFRQFPYGLAAVLVRASVATFFLRAIPRYNNRLPRTVIITIFWAYAVFVTTNTFINAFQCGNPITSTNWTANPDICLPEGVVDGFAKTSKYLNVILDWTMSLIPSYIVFMSSLPRRSKISAIGVLSLAGIGSSISLLALVFYDQSFFDWPSDMPHAFKYSIYILWENGAAIVALSLAAMRPLIDGRWKDELQTDAPRSGVLPSFVNPGEKTEYKEEIVVKERELESEETTANTSVTARAPENEF